jgi:hypothetical protein
MKNSKQIVDSIRKQKKHKDAGHTGGADGCPMCSRASAAKDPLDEILAEEPEQAAPAKEAPVESNRLKKIFGDA